MCRDQLQAKEKELLLAKRLLVDYTREKAQAYEAALAAVRNIQSNRNLAGAPQRVHDSKSTITE